MIVRNLSSASQDYLKVIYRLNRRYGRATTSQIAELLDVKPASVTGMLQKMAQADPPLVTYEKHQGATLTDAGRTAALEMVRHHRLLELFLHEMLGYSWDEVHEEAERLEHVISEELERRIALVLDNPCRDPHGDPIPDQDLILAPLTEFPLSELRPGEEAIVRRVRDEDSDLLRYLDELGIRPHSVITAVTYIPFDRTLTIQVEGQDAPVTIGPQVTDAIFVDILPLTGTN